MEKVVQLHHSALLSIIDHGVTSNGRLYFVEQYSDGLPLDVLLGQAGPLKPRQAALILAVIAEAIAGAHAAGVFHGRVDSSAVVVERQGDVRLRGFGIAESLGESPEPSADVRGLGALARVCVTGDDGMVADVESSPLTRILELDTVDALPSAALVHAGMRRILGELGVEDAAAARAECCEDWSLFFLLHRTFTTEAAESAPDSSPDEGSVTPPPAEDALEDALDPDGEGFSNLTSSMEPGEGEESGESVPVEDVRAVMKPPGMEEELASDFEMPALQRKDGLAELQRLAEIEAGQAKRLQRSIGVAIVVVVILALVAGFVALRGPASEEEIRDQARAELAREMETYSIEIDGTRREGGSPTAADDVTWSPESQSAGILKAVSALGVTSAREIPDAWIGLAERGTPDSPAVVASRGMWLERQDWRQAEALLKRRVLRDSPLEVVVALAELYLRQAKPAEAQQVLRRMDKAGQMDPRYLNALATSCANQRDFTGALLALERLHATGLRTIKHLERIGVARWATGQRELAIEHFRDVVEKDPSRDRGAWMYIGAAESIRDRARTNRFLADLLKDFPNLAPMHLHLAERGLRERKYPTVVSHLATFRRLRPNAWEGAFTQSNLHFRRGALAAASKGYAALRAARPDDPVIAFNQGMTQLALKRGAKAKALFESAARLDPKQWQARCELGKSHQRGRNMAAAKARYREVSELNSRHQWIAQAVPIKLDSAQGDYLLTRPCFFSEIFEDASHSRVAHERP
jgi:tetratricopeptide (TPR) repeat protein